MRIVDGNDIVKKRFGNLVVKELSKRVYDKNSKRFWYFYKCGCDCGLETEVVRNNLLRNHTVSCGCRTKRKASASPCWSGIGEISGTQWNQIQHQAKRRSRKLSFNITIEFIWELFEKQQGRCALTNLPIRFAKADKTTASLDRIDNSRGYEPDNVQWVHKDVNLMRSDLPLDRFKELCILAAEEEDRCLNKK